MMGLLGKVNKFVTVDKETDKIKAQQQICTSWFQELNYDSIKEHIKKWIMEWKIGLKIGIFERMERVYC